MFALYNPNTTHGARYNANIHSHVTVTILNSPLHAFLIFRVYGHTRKPTQWPLIYAAAAAPAPNMAVGVRLAGANPAGAASAPPGVGDGTQMHHHQPPPAARAQVGPDETRASTHASDKDGNGGSNGSGGMVGDAGGRAAAASALRNAHRHACSHETRATTRERRIGWGG